MDTVKSVRLPADVMRTVRYRADTDRTDESTAIRQLLAMGAERYAAELYRRGEISLSKAAELAGTNRREMIEVLLRHGVKGNVTMEIQLEALENLRRLREGKAVTQAASSRS